MRLTALPTRAASPVLRERPLTPERLRYAGWFVAAAWSVDAAAGLFGLDPAALAEALAGRSAA